MKKLIALFIVCVVIVLSVTILKSFLASAMTYWFAHFWGVWFGVGTAGGVLFFVTSLIDSEGDIENTALFIFMTIIVAVCGFIGLAFSFLIIWYVRYKAKAKEWWKSLTGQTQQVLADRVFSPSMPIDGKVHMDNIACMTFYNKYSKKVLPDTPISEVKEIRDKLKAQAKKP